MGTDPVARRGCLEFVQQDVDELGRRFGRPREVERPELCSNPEHCPTFVCPDIPMSFLTIADEYGHYWLNLIEKDGHALISQVLREIKSLLCHLPASSTSWLRTDFLERQRYEKALSQRMHFGTVLNLIGGETVVVGMPMTCHSPNFRMTEDDEDDLVRAVVAAAGAWPPPLQVERQHLQKVAKNAKWRKR